MDHPLIITPTGESRNGERQLFVNRAYETAVERAGGLLLGAGRPKREEDIARLLDIADGILLVGGSDFCPKFYNEENRNCRNIDRERDDLEMALIAGAVKKCLPVLGVCRGMQALNIAFRGTLYQDVAEEMAGSAPHDFHVDENGQPRQHSFIAHDVIIEKGTLLHSIVASERLPVNSLHHQGVRELGKGLLVSARATDGLIEAVEIKDHPFGLGVEWHPEELGDKSSERIFSAFIAAARRSK